MSDMDARWVRHLMRQDQEQGMRSAGAFTGDSSLLGPPHWDKNAWEAYKAQYGHYPYGWVNGTRILPESFEECPEWAYAAMGLRKPPVTVMRSPI